MQSTSTILMIRPYRFVSNPETKSSNAFQNPSEETNDQISEVSLLEFDKMVSILRREGLQILVYQDPGEVETPDSIFPNNWISFHESGEVFLYPMEAPNRRLERRFEAIRKILEEHRFIIHTCYDLSTFEAKNQFLEGTGSMVLDRNYKLAYACLSPRTHPNVLAEFCHISGYRSVVFHAVDFDGKPIYHTNVMMCVGEQFVLACLESISKEEERQSFVDEVEKSGKEFIEISYTQMNHFAGNMLAVRSEKNENLLVLSEQAYNSLTQIQIATLKNFTRLIPIPLDMIEKNGGGSARCMMAEIHLPHKNG